MGSLHARVVNGHPDTELAVVIDPQEAVGRATAERYGASWAPEPSALGDVDAVIVAAATQYHHDIGVEVIERGLPLLMEKPLADRLHDAEDLVARSEAAGGVLMCGFLERYNPGLLTAFQLIESPLHITAQRHSPYVARIRTGVGSDLLIHDADIVVRMMGAEPTSVVGALTCAHPQSEPTSEDIAEAVLTFPSGGSANVSASRLSQRKVRGFVITELDRLIEVDMLRNAVTIYRHVLGENTDEGLSYKQQTIIEIPQIVSNREPLGAQLDRFVALIRGAADVDEERSAILPAHRVVEALRESARAASAG